MSVDRKQLPYSDYFGGRFYDDREPPAVIDPEALASLAGKPCVGEAPGLPHGRVSFVSRPAYGIEPEHVEPARPTPPTEHELLHSATVARVARMTSPRAVAALGSRIFDAEGPGDGWVSGFRAAARVFGDVLLEMARAHDEAAEHVAKLLRSQPSSVTIETLTRSANMDGLDMPQRVQAAIAEAVGVELNRVRHVSISARADGSTWVSALVAAPPEVEP